MSAGIFLGDTCIDGTIKNSTIVGCDTGIVTEGSIGSKILNNTITDCKTGINSDNSYDNIIKNNNLANNKIAISAKYSKNIDISDNIIRGLQTNFQEFDNLPDDLKKTNIR